MPQRWETVTVPLVGGLDTKSDEKSVLPTKLTELINGEFTKKGSLRKRFGHRSVRPRTLDGTDLSGLSAVLPLGDGLVLTDGQKLYSYEAVQDRLAEITDYDATTHTAQEVGFSTYQHSYSDCGTSGEVTVVVWEDSRGGVRGQVFNENTGTFYSADWTVAASDAEKPRVAVVEGNILVFYFKPSNDNIECRVVRPGDVTTSLSDTAVEVVTDVAVTGVYDVCTNGTYAFLAYTTDGTVITGNRLAAIDGAGSADRFVTIDSNTVGSVATAIACTYSSLSDKVYVAHYPSTADIDVATHEPTDLSSVGTPDGTTPASAPTNLALTPDTASTVNLFWEESGASDDLNLVKYKLHTFGTPETGTLRHSGLASRGWYMNGAGYVLLAHSSRTGLQNHYYVYRVGLGIVGRILSGEGVGVLDNDHLPGVTSIGSEFQVALNFKRKLEINTDEPVDKAAVYTHKGTKRVKFNPEARASGAEMDRALYLSGSQLWSFDGASAVESGFHMFPDMQNSDIAHSGSAASNIASGQTYSYRVYYEWFDAHGRRQRSAAITRTFTTTLAQDIRLTIPTLQFTNKLDNVSDVSIVVYRTENNSNIFYYRVSSSDPTVSGDNGYITNDPTADTVTFDDDMSDTNLISQEVDYITQGERANFAPEGPEFVSVAQSRLWLVGGGQRPNDVPYSKPHFDGTAVDFYPDAKVADGPDYGGKTMAVSHIDDKVVIFKERAIYALDGVGPDATGQNGFYQVRAVSFESGCASETVLSHKDGIYFQSQQGIYLLTPSFELVYVGAEVELYNDQAIKAITHVPDSNQIVFLTDSGRTLMYDTYYRQWSTYTNHTGLSACIWAGDTYVYLRGDGDLFIRDTSTYLDAGAGSKMKFRTAPLHLQDSIQGFWRCRKVGVVGSYESSHRLRVSVYYNRDEAPFETFEWTPDSVLELEDWGDDTVWGETGTVWGGTLGSRDYRFTHRLKRQKCETIRFEFEDLSTGSPLGASFELTELTLEVGVRDGLGRIPATRKV